MNKIKIFQSKGLNWSFALLILGLIFCIETPLYAQKQERTRLRAYYEKLPDGDKKISAILTKGRGKSMEGVPEALIVVSTVSQDSTIVLGSLTTDTAGETMLMIESNYSFPINEDYYSEVQLTFEGNDSLRASDTEVEFKDLRLQISSSIMDSTKYVEVLAYLHDGGGNKVPVQELEARVGVKRLYNNLYLGEIETDEEGKAVFEFPNDIPGDSDGIITIGVVLQDHDDFGTVSTYSQVAWGVPVDYAISSNGRSLFGDSAPVWMIITVAIILIGAWFHFLWAVYLVFKMGKMA